MKHLNCFKFTTTKTRKSHFVKYGCFLLALLPLFAFTEKDGREGDKHFPTIELHSPAAHVEVARGKTFTVNALLEDNLELDSYDVRITKGGSSAEIFEKAFSTYQKLDANGNDLPHITGSKSFDLKFDVKVKETAMVGDYIFSLSLKDKAGNERVIKRYFNVSRN